MQTTTLQFRLVIQNHFDKLDLKQNIIITSLRNLVWGESIVLLYERNEKSEKFVDEIIMYSQDSLPKHMIPKYILHINNIPRYDNLKVDYYKLNQYVRKNFK